jgi:hypothetical protein
MTCTITWAKSDVMKLSADFSALTDADFTYFATLAADEIGDSDRFGIQTKLAGILVTAHFLATILYPSAAKIPVLRESALGSQGVSVQYANRTFAASEWSLTQWGIQYQRLLAKWCRGGFLL